jgi:hypothetical protein
MIEVISFESFQEIMVAIRNAERQDTKWRDSFLVPFPSTSGVIMNKAHERRLNVTRRWSSRSSALCKDRVVTSRALSAIR